MADNKTRPATPEYRRNWDRTFGKRVTSKVNGNDYNKLKGGNESLTWCMPKYKLTVGN